jgi:hypothetical protein
MRRLLLLAVLATVGCGGGRLAQSGAPVPETVKAALADFMTAVKANDLARMGALWGTARGPAAGRMKREELHMRLTVIQKYLDHVGYRVLEGPLDHPTNQALRTMRIELQRAGCNAVLPIDLVPARAGGWLVYDVHLENAGNPAARCAPGARGTRP